MKKRLSLISKLLLSIPVVVAVLMGGFFVGVEDAHKGYGLLYIIPALIVFLKAIWKQASRKKFIYNSLFFAAIAYYLIPLLALFSVTMSVLNNPPEYQAFVILAYYLVGAISLMAGVPLGVLFHIIASVYKYKTR